MATPPTRTDKSQFDPCFSSFIPDFSQPKRSSRIEDLLPSNNPPREFEKADLVKIAARGPRTLDEYDGKIAATRKLLDFLVSERDQAASNISDAKALVHPVRDLPDDVLRAIFRACTRPVDEAFNRSFREIVHPSIGIESIQPDQSPWTLSHVCQQWRTVAIHTAELWSLIELNLDERPKDKVLARNRVFRLGLQLFRANGRDLSVRLHGRNGVANVSPILQILLPTAQYWKRLSVFLPLNSFQHFSVCKGSLNRLDTLYIGGPSDFRDWGVNDAFQFIPNLRLLGSFFGDLPFLAYFSMPFSSIEAFMSGGDNTRTYESLKRLPHVQKLFLACCWRFIDELAEPITLHDVTHLHILEPPSLQRVSSSSINMYSHLILPSLQFLKLSFISSRISLPVITDPNSCPITSLTIDICGQSPQECARLDDELPHFLRRTPKLEELRILATSTELPGRWVNDLVYISGQDAIAPRLRVLSMPSGHIPAENIGGLVNVVESRRRMDVDSSDTGHCALLEKVVLGPEPVWFDDEELSARWSALRAGGLIVTCKEE
ncbi:uncharacterized protein EV420DRAFT_1079745 [Desarmillaria tabescens]|uniref:F-box domain-containing protein n=1 Tax=Armillaria tabescens TaxID=1929756 RepID=A0AA39MQ89_ARMTA|nr:uncharacterized protein EV420DRAFT_1079745 [Desarmillaria tabescens]KAK0442278.1 hypothetical protein EV420DRAFT_1079745 [Desarmillaria tabescens]